MTLQTIKAGMILPTDGVDELRVKKDFDVIVDMEKGLICVTAQKEVGLYVTGVGNTYHEAIQDLMQVAANSLKKAESPMHAYLEIKAEKDA